MLTITMMQCFSGSIAQTAELSILVNSWVVQQQAFGYALADKETHIAYPDTGGPQLVIIVWVQQQGTAET